MTQRPRVTTSLNRAADRLRQAFGNVRPAWLTRPEPIVLTALLTLIALSWIFVRLADEVVSGETHHIDQQVLDALRDPAHPSLPRGPQWLADAVRDITALGSPVVLALMTAIVAGYLLLRRQRFAAILMVLAVVSAGLVNTSLKQYFARQRPATALGISLTPSFPSGHAMLSATVYLTLGAMLARAESQRSLQIYFLATAVVLTLLIGTSRIYLGLHYPSDVLAGWMVGAAWALLWWLLARRFGRSATKPES